MKIKQVEDEVWLNIWFKKLKMKFHWEWLWKQWFPTMIYETHGREKMIERFFLIEMFVEDKADIFCLGDFLVLLNQQ